MIKNGRWMALVVVMVMLVTPMAVFAQGGDDVELVEFVSSDEMFKVMVPADWISGEIPDYPFPHVAIANSQDTFDRLMSEEDVDEEPGDKVMLVTVVPLELLGLTGTMLPEEPTLLELTEALAASFLGYEVGDEEAGIGEPEEVELDDDITVGLVTAVNEEGEGVFLVRELSEGVAVMMFVMAMPGEYSDDLTDLGLPVVASVEYSGTAEELIAAMFGETSSETESTGSALDGAALVAERCSVCHTTDRIDAADKDEAGGTTTVDRMLGKGAQLSAEERDAVIQYLVETH